MKYIIVFALALSVQQASAQFGNILNRLEYSAKSKLEGAAVDAAEKAGRNALDSAKKTAKKSKKNKAEAQTWTYGDHDAFGEVTFTNIPTDYNEFEALYSEFLGRTPHGAAAMIPMAMEMYARDREMGKKCIELLSYPSNVNSIISRLKDKFGSDESYGQRYLPAAVLEGATAANGYKPNRPYTVTMEASVNKHQELQIVGEGTVMYIYIIGGGWDTTQRQVELILEPGHEQYQVFNCPSLYTGCRQIRGTWGGLD